MFARGEADVLFAAITFFIPLFFPLCCAARVSARALSSVRLQAAPPPLSGFLLPSARPLRIRGPFAVRAVRRARSRCSRRAPGWERHDPPGRGPVQPAVGDPASTGRLD